MQAEIEAGTECEVRSRVSVQSERRSPIGMVQIARYTLRDPVDVIVPEGDTYQLNMAMVPRPAKARGHYCRHWSSDRYDRLGLIWMAPPGEPVRFRSEPGTTTSVHCSLKPEAVAERLGADCDWRACELDGTLDVAPGPIRALLLRLANELRAPGFASEAMIELVCGQIAIEVSRYRQFAPRYDRPRGLEPWRLRAVEERLAVGGTTPTLAELASICGLSVRQLTRGYRLSQGHSIGDAVANTRIAQAKQLLMSGRSLKGVAHTLGFASASGFIYAFRKATGETPGTFLKRAAH